MLVEAINSWALSLFVLDIVYRKGLKSLRTVYAFVITISTLSEQVAKCRSCAERARYSIAAVLWLSYHLAG